MPCPGRAEEGEGGRAKGARHAVLPLRRGGCKPVPGGEHRPGLFHDGLAGGRGHHRLVAPVDQLHPQLLLQPLQLPAEGGLGHVARRGRVAKVAVRIEGYEILQLRERHRTEGRLFDRRKLSRI